MPNFRALLWVTCRPTFHLGLTRISPRSLYNMMIWYEGLFEDSSCLMNHCVYAGGWAWNIGENANGSGVDDDVLVLDEENLGDNPPFARFLSLTITQCTSSHVHSLHIKKTREGKENNKWPEKSIKHGGSLTKSTDRTCQTFFYSFAFTRAF